MPPPRASTLRTAVTPLADDVSLEHHLSSGAKEFTRITARTDAEEGSRVKTSENGRALIEGTHTALLDHNTEVVIAQADPQKTSLELEVGNIWSRIEKTFDRGEFYEIKTKNAVAAVRGTSFGTETRGEKTIFIVTEGQIAVAMRDPQTGLAVPKSKTILNAGEKAVLEGSKPIIVSMLTREDEQNKWFQLNNPLRKENKPDTRFNLQKESLAPRKIGEKTINPPAIKLPKQDIILFIPDNKPTQGATPIIVPLQQSSPTPVPPTPPIQYPERVPPSDPISSGETLKSQDSSSISSSQSGETPQHTTAVDDKTSSSPSPQPTDQ